MKKIYTLVVSLLLLSIAGCSQQRENMQELEQKAYDGTLTLTTYAPSWDAETRAMVSEQEGSLNLISSFKSTDKVRLFVVQGDKIYDLKEVEFASLSEDKQVAKLTITLPAGVDATQPIDIIGYNGLNQSRIKMVDGYPKVSVNAFLHHDIEKFDAPVYFRVKGLVPSDEAITERSVKFEHLGAYAIVHFENKSAETIKGKVTISEVSSYGPKMSWAYMDGYDSAQGGTVYYQYDIITGEVTSSTERMWADYYVEPDINSGETKSVISWMLPKEGAVIPNLVLDYVKKGDYKSIQSKGMIPGKSYGMQAGNVYHAYGYWDGEAVVCMDPETDEVRPEAFFSVTTNIPVGKTITLKTYTPYGSNAWVDLDNNGVKDVYYENAPKNFSPATLTVKDPKITFYGAFESIEIVKQGITEVHSSPVAPVTQIDLRDNELSKEALNTLFEELPDINNIEKSILSPKTLKISGNPGADRCNAKVAIKKGWILDVLIVDESQPYGMLGLGSYGSKDFYIIIDAPEESRENVWIDLNGDGEKNEGEKVTVFGNLSKYTALNDNVVFYGDITTINLIQGNAFAYFGGNNDKLKYLNLANTGVVAAVTKGHPNLEVLNLNGNKLYTEAVPLDVSNLTKLKVLDIGNCEAGQIDFSNNTALTYLNIEGNGMETLDLTPLTKIKQLICSSNKIKTLDISKLTDLIHLEVTQNELSSEQVNAIIDALPDRTGKSKGGFWIANNPGTGTGNFHIATGKNWTVDARNSKADNKVRRPIMEGEDW